MSKYALKDSDGNIYESSPDEMHERIAHEVSEVESKYGKKNPLAAENALSERDVYELIKNFEYIIPQAIKDNPEAKKKFEEIVSGSHKLYKELLNMGMEAEDARYILPNASESKILVTMNGRELMHFFTVRCCNRAQWEIREMATSMLKQVKKVAPVVFEKAGPNCLRIPCPEGKFQCENPPKAADFKP